MLFVCIFLSNVYLILLSSFIITFVTFNITIYLLSLPTFPYFPYSTPWYQPQIHPSTCFTIRAHHDRIVKLEPSCIKLDYAAQGQGLGPGLGLRQGQGSRLGLGPGIVATTAPNRQGQMAFTAGATGNTTYSSYMTITPGIFTSTWRFITHLIILCIFLSSSSSSSPSLTLTLCVVILVIAICSCCNHRNRCCWFCRRYHPLYRLEELYESFERQGHG